MFDRVCIVSIAMFVFCSNVTACTTQVGPCQADQHNNLVGQATIPNGTIGIRNIDHNLVGSAVNTNLIPAKAVQWPTGLTPGQAMYIIQSTQTNDRLGSGTIIPYNPVWYLPSW